MSHTQPPTLLLKAGKEKSILQRHPWIFSGAFAQVPEGLADGAIVQVANQQQQFMAIGHYTKSSIMVRILSFEKLMLDQHYWNEVIEKAWIRRKLIFEHTLQTNAFRLVHGEGDQLPGLIVDVYNFTAVIQCHSPGMLQHQLQIAQALLALVDLEIKVVYNKKILDTDSDRCIHGTPETVVCIENGIYFEVDYQAGQKTGFFLDQRENRKLIGQYAKGKTVLNTFSYSGGFSLYALAAGALKVTSVDSAKKASHWTNQNLELNKNIDPSRHQFLLADAFEFIKSNPLNEYDLIVLDPPAFAKHLDAVKRAMIGYRNLNAETMKGMKSNSLLFTFSCSQVIDKDLFRKIIFQAAMQAKRKVSILHQLSQPADHPINVYHPEGEYLKGLVLLVA